MIILLISLSHLPAPWRTGMFGQEWIGVSVRRLLVAGLGEMWYDSLTEGNPETGAMSLPLLTTKFFMPAASPKLVPRPQLIQQLVVGLRLGHRLTLASAPAGFGKTTLLSDWLRHTDRPVAWLSLDDGDNDPSRFLAYLVAALQRINPDIGQTARAMLQAPRSASRLDPLLTTLINDIVATSRPFILVLDDFHVIEASPIHRAVSFLLDGSDPHCLDTFSATLRGFL